MSKEQTPITVEELYISIADVLGRHWEVDVENTEKCVQIAEQYAQAKVLEVLERDRKQFGDFLLNRRSEELSKGVVNFMRPVTCRDIEHYETEVKPKYEKGNSTN